MGPNAFADVFDLTFASANAVGLDVFAGPFAGTVLISVFGPSSTLLGSFTIISPAGGTFFGVVTDIGAIGRLRIASVASAPGELVDNVAFGTTVVPEPTTIVLLGTGLGAAHRRGARYATGHRSGQRRLLALGVAVPSK